MKVVTTVHKAGYEQYGYRWVESMENWPGAEFCMYAEGFEPPCPFKRCEDLPRLCAFKEAHKTYQSPNWQHDVVRFSNKVFAAHDAFYTHDGIGVWLDADAVTYRPIPPGFVEEQLGGAFFAHFKRADWYTETGLWIIDCRNPETKPFLDTWVDWFESGAFKNLHEWHDCTTLDATLRLFLNDRRITTKSLSGEFERDMHPMAKAEFGKWVDHTKGRRKIAGFSPENKHREAS